MKCFSKKLFCYLLVGFLSFGCVSTSYYKSVHAMEWAGGALAFEEAIKWLLAAIGITATAGATDAFWESHGDDFVQKCEQDGITQSEIASWQLKACEGIIDKTSACWQSFKEWALSLINNNNSGSLPANSTMEEVINYINNSLNLNLPVPQNYASDTIGSFFLYPSEGAYGGWNVYLYKNVAVTTPNIISSNGAYYYGYKEYNHYEWGYGTSTGTNSMNHNNAYISSNIINNTIYNPNILDYGEAGGTSDTGFDSVTGVNENIDIINDTGEDSEEEVKIKTPGLADSNDDVSSSTYDDIIDAINEGTLSIDDAVEDIQAILGVIAYDTVTDDVVPNKPDPDTGGNKKKDDVIKENKNNMTFTLAGLENIFPFCIPWDVYAFINILNAEPTPPVFQIPLLISTNRTEMITVDLRPWDNAFRIWRYCLDFLFIVGLAIATRKFIGAGGDE